MGSVYIVIIITIAFLLTYLAIKPFTHKVKIFRKMRDYFKRNNLLWGFVIRTLLEASLELAFAC